MRSRPALVLIDHDLHRIGGTLASHRQHDGLVVELHIGREHVEPIRSMLLASMSIGFVPDHRRDP